ncbi:MAG: TackOD1 domain-containing metal-binding protein [Nitrososphaerales archaeon]
MKAKERDLSAVEEGTETSQEAMDLYNIPAVQDILSLLIEGEVDELKSAFDPTYICRYPEVEKVTELQPAEVPPLLEKLASMGVLKANTSSHVPACEKCGSPNLALNFQCPSCQFNNLEKRMVIEHTPCGYVDVETRFKWEGAAIVCPRCGKSSRTDRPDIRMKGSWFYCNNCEKRARDPTITLKCRDCGRTFEAADVSLVRVFSYVLGDRAKDSTVMLVKPLMDSLRTIGWETERSGILVGRSGTQHKYSLVSRKDKMTIAIDVAVSNIIVNESPVIKIFAKGFDSKPDASILISIPGSTNQAQVLAKQYGILMVEASTNGEVIEKLDALVRNLEKSLQGILVE